MTAHRPAPQADPLDSATYAELVAIVGAWQYDRARAEAAWLELLARRRVVERCGFDPAGVERFGNGAAPASSAPPWEAEQPRPRVVRWQRPTGSTLYPAPEDEARQAMDAVARSIWNARAAGAPRKE